MPVEPLEPAAGAVSSLFIVACAAAAASGELNVAPGIPGTVYTVFGGAELRPDVVPEIGMLSKALRSGRTAFPAVTSDWCENGSPASSASAPDGDASRTLESYERSNPSSWDVLTSSVECGGRTGVDPNNVDALSPPGRTMVGPPDAIARLSRPAVSALAAR